MRIGQVARKAGIAPSAIRYYERIGLIPPPPRLSGRRDFAPDILERLVLIAHGRACGVRLEEMKDMLAVGQRRPPPAIWKPLVTVKLDELMELEKQLAARRARLIAMRRCRCRSIEGCARLLWERQESSGPQATSRSP